MKRLWGASLASFLLALATMQIGFFVSFLMAPAMLSRCIEGASRGPDGVADNTTLLLTLEVDPEKEIIA
jgi:hypothetical protein